MHVTAYVKAPEKHHVGPVAVLFGKDAYLKQEGLAALARTVLDGEQAAAGLTRFDGNEADFVTLVDELRTISMWSQKRLVAVEDADDFVSENRARLEKYLARPAKKSVLVLTVKSWPKNTRLARIVAKIGLDLECAALSGSRLTGWLVETAREEHGKSLSRDTAQLLTQLAGGELGLLQQQLEKLTAYVGDRSRIEAGDVRLLVGGWKAEQTWTMTAAVRDGDLARALGCLDKLLAAGEPPQKIAGGISYVFRKLAQTTELARQGSSLKAALSRSGVFPGEVDSSARYLRRITRPRAERLYDWLLQIDAGLKGESRLSQRLQLELLLIKLSGRLPQTAGDRDSD